MKVKNIKKNLFYYFLFERVINESQFFYLDFSFLKFPSIWIFLDSFSF